jgi:hypothetical protein
MKVPVVFLERAAKEDLRLQDPWSKASASLRHSLLVADGTIRSLSTHLYRQRHTPITTAALVNMVPASC